MEFSGKNLHSLNGTPSHVVYPIMHTILRSHQFTRTLLTIVALIGSFTMVGIPHSFAPPRDNYHIDRAKELSENEAVNYLYSMRGSAYAQSYVFQFKLKHYPYRARAITYSGILYGEVDAKTGIQTERVLIQDRDPQNPRKFITLNDFLLVRGQTAQAWIRTPDSSEVVEPLPGSKENSEREGVSPALEANSQQLYGDALFQPILENITLNYFDLLVPYFYWGEYEYLGPNQVKARPTQGFRLYNPEADTPTNIVELQLDDKFRAILKASYLNAEDVLSKSMELISFKKTEGNYIPKTIDYRSYEDKGDKTRIDIIAAAMEVKLPTELFQKENLGKELPAIEPFVFDVF